MEILVGLILTLVAVPLVVPILAWLSARRTRARLQELEALVSEQRNDIDRLMLDLKALRREGVTPSEAAPVEPVQYLGSQPQAKIESYEAPATPLGVDTTYEPEQPAPEPAQPVPEPAQPVPEPAPQATAPKFPPQEMRPGRVHEPPAPPPPPPPAVPVQPAPAFDWESLVGVKLFSAIAGVALVIAAVFFLRYSIDSGWLQPPVRVAIGIFVAVVLLVTCELKAARRYPVTADALDAAAIAILFATFFAAHALWDLIPTTVTFGLLTLVTALAVLLSIRRESLFIAVLGLLGGFATPALLSTGENRPVPLFSYLLLLNVGLAWVAYRNRWPVLTWLTLLLTTIYQWGWVDAYLDASALPLAMGIFVLFPLVSIAALLLAGIPADRSEGLPGVRAFNGAALTSAGLPVLFAVYLATVPEYGARPALLFGFVLLIDLGLLALTIARGQELLHATGAVATILAVALWLAVSYTSDGRHLLLGFAAAFVLFFIFAPTAASWFDRPFDNVGKNTLWAGPLMLFVFPVVAQIDPAFAAPWPLFLVLLPLVLVIAHRAIVMRRGSLYFVASFFAIATQATWSDTHLTIDRLGTATAIFAMFGLVALAVPVAARRLDKPLEPAGGGGAVLLASLLLLLGISAGSIAPAALWALAMLLTVLNAALFVESASGRMPLVSQAGSLLSWIVLATWWGQAAGSVGVIPSLAVLMGLSLLTLAGHAWCLSSVSPDAPAPESRSFSNGLYLAFGGHLFLLFLALNREWALPPWPLFGALVVLMLATSAAALFSQILTLHAAGVIASAVVIAAWSSVGGSPPYGIIALAASMAVSGYAVAWILLPRADDERRVATGAAVSLLIGELAALAAVAGGGAPPLAAVVVVHVANVGCLLWLSVRCRWEKLPLIAVAPAWLSVLQWQFSLPRDARWFEPLILASALYAVFAVFPIALGRRALGREPYLAAVIAGAMFFFGARAAFIAGGLDWMIGVVPVVAGGVLALLLRQLLAIQPEGERDMGRLAIVAGAALAFVTVAIPLQLRHQWITIGWAMEGAALAWLYKRIPHRGLLFAGVGLLGTVFVRLALNPEILLYEPRGALRILNWYLYTYALCAAAMMVAGRWLSKTDDRLASLLPRASHVLPAAGVVLLFLLLNIEIADFYATGPAVVFRFGATLSQDLTYTIGWLSFGMTLLSAGIYLRSRTARVAAVALIAVTTFKCFLYDLRSLEGLYRVASFVGLAMSLALVSLALQKFVLSRPRESA